MDELLKAMQMFQEGVQRASIQEAVNDATVKVDEIKRASLDETQKRAALTDFSDKLALRLVGAGANAATIQQAFQAVKPQQFGSAEQMQLEGELTGNKQYQDVSSKIIKAREERALALKAREEQMKLAVEEKKGMLDIKKELIKSGLKPSEIKPEELAFQTNVKMAHNFIDDLEKAIDEAGTGEVGVPFASNRKAKAVFEAVPYQLAITYAKLVDPNSVAREGEVEATKKYLLSIGLTSSSEEAKAKLNHLRKTIKRYEVARGSSARPGMAGQAPSKESEWQVKRTKDGKNVKFRLLPNGDFEVE